MRWCARWRTGAIEADQGSRALQLRFVRNCCRRKEAIRGGCDERAEREHLVRWRSGRLAERDGYVGVLVGLSARRATTAAVDPGLYGVEGSAGSKEPEQRGERNET